MLIALSVLIITPLINNKNEPIARDNSSQGENTGKVDELGQPNKDRDGGVTEAPVKEPLDLLSRIDISRDSVKGKWSFDGKTLVSPKVDLPKLRIACPFDDEYQLTVIAERASGDNTFVIGLVVRGQQVAVILDGYRSKISGLELVNGKGVGHNNSTYRQPVFTNGEPCTIICRVQKDEIDVSCNGQPIIKWVGQFDELSIPTVWSVPDRQALILGTDGRNSRTYRVSKIEIEKL